jgi:hypothetical protein
MEHKYNAKQEESILPTQYLPWKEVFEQKAAERFPGKHPWDHAIELRDVQTKEREHLSIKSLTAEHIR